MTRIAWGAWWILIGCATSGVDPRPRPLAVGVCDHALGCDDAPSVEANEPPSSPTATQPPLRLADIGGIELPTAPTIEVSAGWVSLDPSEGHARLTEVHRRLSANLGENERELRHLSARLHLAIALHPATPPAEATVQRDQARTTLEALLDDPSDLQRDRILLSLAWLRAQQGDDRGMKDAVLQLVRERPTSPLLGQAFLFMADLVSEREPDAATKLYRKAATFPGAATYAHYRVAWVMLATDRPREALESFVATIDASRDAPPPPTDPVPGELLNPSAAELRLAALRELVIPYAEVGAPSKAWRFFSRLADGHEGLPAELMIRLAAAHRARDQVGEARSVCASLAANAPASAPSCPAP